MNAHIERWIKSRKNECLDHFIPVDGQHLDYLIPEYVEHYHHERPHQGIGNRPIMNDRLRNYYWLDQMRHSTRWTAPALLPCSLNHSHFNEVESRE